ncbi:hypothetical protein AAMO2058_001571100 [Amorphochlora amoebiformis]|uniref:Uncharacterized protein n=1 Tax=Amorphochlora amoebiformis TaxID=1561963 RepID=A0A7S0DK13_9EUKA|eukprot:1391551-Amorphochlora_amoeboformis.AAC.1
MSTVHPQIKQYCVILLIYEHSTVFEFLFKINYESAPNRLLRIESLLAVYRAPPHEVGPLGPNRSKAGLNWIARAKSSKSVPRSIRLRFEPQLARKSPKGVPIESAPTWFLITVPIERQSVGPRCRSHVVQDRMLQA